MFLTASPCSTLFSSFASVCYWDFFPWYYSFLNFPSVPVYCLRSFRINIFLVYSQSFHAHNNFLSTTKSLRHVGLLSQAPRPNQDYWKPFFTFIHMKSEALYTVPTVCIYCQHAADFLLCSLDISPSSIGSSLKGAESWEGWGGWCSVFVEGGCVCLKQSNVT